MGLDFKETIPVSFILTLWNKVKKFYFYSFIDGWVGVGCAIIDGYQSVENEVKSEVNGRVVVIVVIYNWDHFLNLDHDVK